MRKDAKKPQRHQIVSFNDFMHEEEENEEVIEKILHRRPEMKSIDDLNEIQTAVNRPDAMELTQFIQKYGERRRYGHIFLPDHCGFGPFYFCLLKKNLAS